MDNEGIFIWRRHLGSPASFKSKKNLRAKRTAPKKSGAPQFKTRKPKEHSGAV